MHSLFNCAQVFELCTLPAQSCCSSKRQHCRSTLMFAEVLRCNSLPFRRQKCLLSILSFLAGCNFYSLIAAIAVKLFLHCHTVATAVNSVDAMFTGAFATHKSNLCERISAAPSWSRADCMGSLQRQSAAKRLASMASMYTFWPG